MGKNLVMELAIFDIKTLKGQFMIIIEFFFKGPSESAPREKNRGTSEKGLS